MKMNYVVVGTNDREAAAAFYDALFEGTGFARVFASDRMTFWQCDDFTFAVADPFDGNAASHGNGTMVGFGVDTAGEVERLHARTLQLGGACEGEPGQRGPRFSAYVRDPDGNKLCFFA